MKKYLDILINNNKEILNELLIIINKSLEEMKVLYIENKKITENKLVGVFLNNAQKYKINSNLLFVTNLCFLDRFNEKENLLECIFVFQSKEEKIAIKIIMSDSKNIGYSFRIENKRLIDEGVKNFFSINNKNSEIYMNKDNDTVNFKFAELGNGSNIFKIISLPNLTQESLFSKDFNIAANNHIEMFSEYFFLKKKISQEFIDMLYLKNDLKVEMNESLLKQYRINIDKINLKKDCKIISNKTVNTL